MLKFNAEKVNRILLRLTLTLCIMVMLFLAFKSHIVGDKTIPVSKIPQKNTGMCPFYRGSLKPGEKAGYPDSEESSLIQDIIAAGDIFLAEEMVEYPNLFRGREKWIAAAETMSQYEKLSPIYYTTLEMIKDVDKRLCLRYRNHKKQFDIAMVQGRYDQAMKHLNIILASFPDTDDPRYTWAKKARISTLREQSKSR